MRRLALILPSVVLVGSSGCVEPGTTCDLDSSEIVLTTTAINAEMSWQVEVVLERTGDVEEPLTICGQDDALTINGADATEEVVYGIARYVATLDADVDTVEVEYSRNNGDVFVATVDTPPGFMVTNPDAGAAVSRSMDTDVRWSPAGPEGTEVEIELRADDVLCLEEWTEPVPDTGQFDLPGGEVTLGPSAMSEGTTECDASLELTRSTVGEVEAGLASSSEIAAYRKRAQRIRSVP